MVFSGTMSRRSLPGLLLALAACAGGPPTAATSEPAPQSNTTDALVPSETATISTELASLYQGVHVAGVEEVDDRDGAIGIARDERQPTGRRGRGGERPSPRGIAGHEGEGARVEDVQRVGLLDRHQVSITWILTCDQRGSRAGATVSAQGAGPLRA